MANRRYTKKQVEDALRKTYGLKSYTAKHLGCDLNTVNNYIKRYPSLQIVLDEMRELKVDIGESKLMSGVQEGNPTLIQYLLSTLGKDRGFYKRTENEHSGPGGGPIKVEDQFKGWTKEDVIKYIIAGDKPSNPV